MPNTDASGGRPTEKRKSGPWWVFHPGWLLLYGVISLILLIAIFSTWSSGGFAIPGLIGILFFVMTGRQIWLASQGNPYKVSK